MSVHASIRETSYRGRNRRHEFGDKRDEHIRDRKHVVHQTYVFENAALFSLFNNHS